MAHHTLVKTKIIPKSQIKDPQQQFQAHWKTIEKLQRDITTQHKRQQALLARFRAEMLPVEHQYIQALYDKTSRLLSFGDKKSLGKYDREALFLWIEEAFDELLHHPFNEHLDLDALRQRFFVINKVVDVEPTQDEIDYFRQNINEMFEHDVDLNDEELIKMMFDPENLFTTIDRLFDEAESYADSEDDESNDDGTHIAGNVQQDLDNLFKTAEVNKMYKKLAGIIHPDREPELAKKEEKHQLMVQLSKAKKNHDIWTIVEMYHQYVDPEFHFSPAEIPAINVMLQRRIDTLTTELAEISEPHSLSGMIWERFGAKTAKTIDNKFRKHREQLQKMIENETQIRNELRSLAVLKSYLVPFREQFDFKRAMRNFI